MARVGNHGGGAKPPLSDEDLAFAYELVDTVPGSFIGGSYIVKGSAAGDIDVVIPHAAWRETRERLGDRIYKVLAHIPVENEDTLSDIEDDERLITVYRRGCVDLIVVRDEYVDSYRKAVLDMAREPEKFQSREERVAIHIFYADEVRRERGGPLEADIVAARRERKGWSGHHGTGNY